MINFIVCDDNKRIVSYVKQLIDRIMIKNKIAYQVHMFFDYNSEFYNIIKENLASKIYILDIETPSGSGIDIAKKIRKIDIDSILIFLTSHNELGNLVLNEELMFLTFICKFDEMDKRLESSIKKAISIVGTKQAIRFEDQGVIYTILLKNILCVTTSTVDRKTIIETDYAVFKVNKTFAEITNMLDGNFKQSHRSCYINMNRVTKIDKRNNFILFDNNKTTYLLSDTYKKRLD